MKQIKEYQQNKTSFYYGIKQLFFLSLNDAFLLLLNSQNKHSLLLVSLFLYKHTIHKQNTKGACTFVICLMMLSTFCHHGRSFQSQSQNHSQGNHTGLNKKEPHILLSVFLMSQILIETRSP